MPALIDVLYCSTGYPEFALKLVGALREAVELDLEGADEREVHSGYIVLLLRGLHNMSCDVVPAGAVWTSRQGKHRHARQAQTGFVAA